MKMRILNLMLAKGRGGLETMALRYHQALVNEGFEVLSLGHPEGILATELKNAVYKPLNSYFARDPFAASKLKSIAKFYQADLIFAHGNRAISLCSSRFAGLSDKTLGVVHNFRSKSDLGGVKAAICVSLPVQKAVKAAHPKLETHHLANFTPLKMHPVKPFPLEEPFIGTLGRLHTNKGLEFAIQAVALLRDQGLRVQLRIAGEGPEKESLQKLVAKLGLTDQVGFLGWTEPVDTYLAGLDMFILPSRVEPFGLVLTEAMAAGIPVIASRIDGPEYILNQGKLGALIEPQNSEALANAIKAITEDWVSVLNRAHYAQAHALETYGLLAGQTRLKALVEDMAA
jgi:glycosyltransferase involved in cell wall biosynthesis